METISEKGETEQIIKYLKGKDIPALIQECHKKNIVITKDDIEKWRYRGYKPSKKYRKKILDIIKNSC